MVGARLDGYGYSYQSHSEYLTCLSAKLFFFIFSVVCFRNNCAVNLSLFYTCMFYALMNCKRLQNAQSLQGNMANSAINLHEHLFLIEVSFGLLTDSHLSSRCLKSQTKTYPIMLFSWSYMHNCNSQHYLIKLTPMI